MESPLSFNSSENFRKKLLVRNLQPYSVDQVFTSSDIPGISDLVLIDYSVIDSPSVVDIGQVQEQILYNQNQYGPDNGNEIYGNTVNINLNLNTETNQGIYSFLNTIGSELELLGDFQETLLYVNNLYGPQNQTSYGDTVDINQNLQSMANIGEYDITDTFGSDLETIGNFQEVTLYTNNLYGPEGTNSYGDSVNINQNLQSTANIGEYDVTDTIGSTLETIGNFQEVILYTNNLYGPEGTNSYGNIVDINQNLQSTANIGEYDITDTVGSELESIGNFQETILYTNNIYGPEGNDGYGDQVNINQNQQTTSNQGEYGPIVWSIQRTAEQSRNIFYVANEYGPENPDGYGNQINTIITSNLQTTTNQGEYDYELSPPSLTSEQSQTEAYGDNKYVNGEGSYEVATITDVTDLIERTFLPYAESTTTFIFVPSHYTPYNILLQDNPQGSDGSLTEDSSLAQIAAERLQSEFKARVALELLQQTLNRVNAFNTSVDPDSGQISATLNTDPFNAIGIVSGNIPLFARNYSITRPDLLFGQGINFAAKLAGLYSPYSYIPGEYFDYPNKRLVNELIENPIATVVGSVLGAINKITSLNIENGSELFLANTTNATSDLLFQQLSYNLYRPDYRLNSFRDPNLLAPKPSFYVGDRKTFLKGITPIDQQPVNKFGDNTDAAVFGHGGIGTDYETYKGQSVDQRFYFGLTTRGYYDGSNNVEGTDSGTIYGGFTWGSSKSGSLYKKVGYNNEVFGDDNQENDFKSGLNSTLAGDYKDFRPDSILDVTNKLVEKGEQAKGIYRQKHVGNAISQVSKVFNDGNIELTKGSRVIKYSTPSSVGSKNANAVVGYEYCRVFTKDSPYYLYNDLQKTDGNIRKFQNSVLTNTYNLNIAPTTGEDSTTIDTTNKRVKKYMFSLENLAWRTSNRRGFTVEDLPIAERGPNGGRIMWFPPYDVSFDESVKTSWTDHTFLGRTEPVYTYSNTSRSGSLSWKIVVDHPSILNLIVNKELAKTSPESKLTKIVDSFFAGCLKYDIYDLLKKYAQFTIADVYDVLLTTQNPETFNQAAAELPPQTTTQTSTTAGGGGTPKDFKDYVNKTALYFDDSVPESGDETDYGILYTAYLNKINSNYQTLAENKKIEYTNQNYEDVPTADKSDLEFFTNYIDATIDGINDFKSFIESNYNTFNTLKTSIKEYLSQGNNELTIELTGGASATGSVNSNKKLGERRVTSIKKWLETDPELKKYINDTKVLKIVDKSEGNAIVPNVTEKNYNKINCSKKFNGVNSSKLTGYYSVNAMACRTVVVSNITTKEIEKPNESATNTSQTDASSVAPAPNAAEDNAPTTQTAISTDGQPQTSGSNVTPQPRQDIVKRLLRKLLTESDYFEMIKEDEPMVYDGIKQKIKHFNPAFHSMTPEGLNSRLTFLQQCMRPGDTIPTVQKNKNQTTYVYGDAFNTAFGAPPVCVLRIGDFFHTKVIIDSLTIGYPEDGLFDLNPEGIGVQPMIAEVKLGFNFIGGQGLKQPIEQLQNALSFNYYANTEVYDERAEETEAVDQKITTELIEIAQDSLGIITDLKRPDEKDGQATIGTILNQVVDPTGNTITGEIQYKDVFTELVDNAQEYYTSTFEALKKVNDDLLYGGIVLSTANVKYREGEIISTGSTNSKIFGYPVKIQQKVDDLFKKAKEDVDNDLCPLLYMVNDQNFKNSDIRDVKKNIKQMIDSRKSNYLEKINNGYKDSIKSELKLVNLIDKLNFVSGERDGYKNKKNEPIIYEISGSEVTEYKNDYAKIANDIQTFYDVIIPTGIYSYNENYTFDLYLNIENETYLPSENRFFMIFGKDILDNTESVIDELNSPVENSDDRSQWDDYFRDQFDDLDVKYINSRNVLNKLFEEVENSTFYQGVNTNYKAELKNKERKVSYIKQDPTNQTDGDNLVKLYRTVSEPDDKFNFKKEFKD